MQYGGHTDALAKGPVLNATFVKDTLLVVYADLNIGRYRVLNLEGSFVAYQDDLLKLRCTDMNHNSLPGICPYFLVAIAMAGRRQEQKNLDNHLPKRGSFKNVTRNLPMRGMGAFQKSLSRKFQLKNLLSNSAPTESALLLCCDYFDNAITMHSTEALNIQYKCAWLHRGPITCIAVGENGLVVTGGSDATCRVWILDHPAMAMALLDSNTINSIGSIVESDQLQRLACVHVLWGHQSPISSVRLSNVLDVVVSGGADGTICVHRALSGEFIRFIDIWSFERDDASPTVALKRGIRRVAISKWGILVIHTEDGMLHKCTVNGAILLSIETRDLLNALEISLEGETVVSGGQSGLFLARKMTDFSVVYNVDLSLNGPIEHISLSPNSSSFLTCCICVCSKNGALALVYPKKID